MVTSGKGDSGAKQVKGVNCMVCVCVRARILSHIQLFEIPRDAACQAPLNFSGKNTGASCYFPLQGIFLTQGWNPHLTNLQHWQADSLPLNHLGSPEYTVNRLDTL